MVDSIEGKVALVTGAASGIGAELVRNFVSRGAQVLATDVNAEKLTKIVEETGCESFNGDISTFECNQLVVEKVMDLHGKLDFALLNAGILGRNFAVQRDGYSSQDLSPEFFSKVRAVNLDAVVYGTLAAVPMMEAQGGGSIVVTVSTAGLVPHTPDPFYTATKHAAVGWVRSIAPALSDQKVRINAICPGGVSTPLIGVEPGEISSSNRLEPIDVANAIIETATETETGRALTVLRSDSPIRQLFEFTEMSDYRN